MVGPDQIREAVARAISAVDATIEDPEIIADEIIAALADAGLVIVPREPTEEMALNGLAFSKSPGPMINNIWRAMIANYTPFG